MEAKIDSGRVTLFRQKSPEGLTYRIPALLYLPPESTFLAFAEERSSPKDEDAKFLVMRRGKKEGTTVQAKKAIALVALLSHLRRRNVQQQDHKASESGELWSYEEEKDWGPQEPLMTATLPNHRTMNPCPVYEKKSGTIFLFFICVESHISEWHQIRTGRNAARLCHVFSQDGGRTWSQITDLTERVIGDDLRNWATFAVGPGHGLQLGNGRLVIPAYTYYINKRCFGHPLFCWVKSHSFMFYSDDLGQTWARGQLMDNLQTSECQVAELLRQDKGPVLYCNARTPGRYRSEAFSMDSGDQFERSFLCRELFGPPGGCQGSVVSFTPMQVLSTQPSSSHKDSKSWLIFSHPTNRYKRLDLGIFLNTFPLDQGQWKAPWVLYKGPSGYSDLAVCEEERSLLFGCLFECGMSSPYEEIAFQLFTNVENSH